MLSLVLQRIEFIFLTLEERLGLEGSALAPSRATSAVAITPLVLVLAVGVWLSYCAPNHHATAALAA